MTLALVFFKPTALTAIFLLVRKMQTIKYYFFFFLGCYLLLSFLNGICFLFYGFGISRKLLTIISETNHNEVIEFLPELIATLKPLVFSVKFLVTLIIFVLLWRLLPVIPSRFYLPTVITISLFGLSYFIHDAPLLSLVKQLTVS